ncbi:MAG TPA: hypothetical protein VJU14_10030 [Solirubrobacterales bacterium]|nr:hypothetical protein [Solirubrobacterales bacterium]
MLAVSAGLIAGAAERVAGEQRQRGNLVVSLDGSIAPLKLPRDRPAPVSVRLEGGLRTDDGSLLPRVERIELGLPRRGVLDGRGLPTCSPRRLRYATTEGALEACGPALVGRGRLDAKVVLPSQAPFAIHARLLAFNARLDGRAAVVVHGFAPEPVTIAVLVFAVRGGRGELGTTLVAELPRALGPWPRVARFRMTLGRRFTHRGERRSYLRASCPLPPRLTAGFFPLASTSFELAGGRRLGTEIIRGCRAAD